MCLKYHDIELLVAKYSQNKEPEFHFSSPQIKTEKIAKEARHVYDSFFASTEYSIHLVIIVYSYLLFCYTPFKKQFWRIRNATLSCYTY